MRHDRQMLVDELDKAGFVGDVDYLCPTVSGKTQEVSKHPAELGFGICGLRDWDLLFTVGKTVYANHNNLNCTTKVCV